MCVLWFIEIIWSSCFCWFNRFEFNKSASFWEVYIDLLDFSILLEIRMQCSNIVEFFWKIKNYNTVSFKLLSIKSRVWGSSTLLLLAPLILLPSRLIICVPLITGMRVSATATAPVIVVSSPRRRMMIVIIIETLILGYVLSLILATMMMIMMIVVVPRRRLIVMLIHWLVLILLLLILRELNRDRLKLLH